MAAAAASSPLAYYVSPTSYHYHSTKKQRKITRLSVVIRNCSAQSETPITTQQEEDEEEESSKAALEVPRGPPSLISTLNVDKALRGIPITDADHYGRLGLRIGCSYEEVTLAYNNKAADLAMNEAGLSEEELSKELELLKESQGILSSVEERRLYDWSLARTGKPDRYMWPFEVDITQTPTGIPPPREPEDEGPTRLVGYFMLSWLILSIALFIIFNR